MLLSVAAEATMAMGWMSGQGGDGGGRRCCTRSGLSLLVEEGGQLWRRRKGRHLWARRWRKAVAGGRFVDDAEVEERVEREGRIH